MTDDILQELEESERLAAAATPGPWGAFEAIKGKRRKVYFVQMLDADEEFSDIVAEGIFPEDAKYLASVSPDRIARWREAFALQAEELRILRELFDDLQIGVLNERAKTATEGRIPALVSVDWIRSVYAALRARQGEQP